MKRMFKKLVSLLLAMLIMFGSATFAGFMTMDFSVKAEAVESGTCGENLTWSLNTDTGELIISGQGDMTSAPWDVSYVKTVTIQDGVTSICARAFEDCSELTSVTIPNSMLVIGNHAFVNCVSLTEVEIPSSVETINASAFGNCTNLESFIIQDGAETVLYQTVFGSAPNLTRIKFPDGVRFFNDNSISLVTTGYYNDISNWSDNLLYVDNHLICARVSVTTETVEIKSGTVNIAGNVFFDYPNLSHLLIPDSVVNIGRGNFNNSKGLIKVCFGGSESDWENITIAANNKYLTSAPKIFNHVHDEFTPTVVVGKTVESCESSGYSGDVYCSECDWLIEKGQYVEALEHNYEEIAEIPAICTSNGLKFAICSNCKQTTIEEYQMATGHIYTSKTIKPTCIDGGYTYNVCTKCGYSTITEETDAAGHDYVDTEVESSCTGVGYTLHQCETCGDRYVTNEIPVKGHNYEPVFVAPSCTTVGYTIYLCSDCGVAYKSDKKEALGHNIVIDEAVEATCSETGLTEGQHCTRCNNVTVEQNTVSALGHDIIIDESVEATCTETGLTAGQHCSRCDDATIKQEIVPLVKHSYSVKFDAVNHWLECSCEAKEALSKHEFGNDNICDVCQYERIVNSKISIKNNPGSTSINYGETIELTSSVTNKLDYAKIYWFVDGIKKGEGESFSLSFEDGTKTVEVKLVDENGFVLKDSSGKEILDSEKITVKADFFQKLISFFKNLFGANRTIVQTKKV